MSESSPCSVHVRGQATSAANPRLCPVRIRVEVGAKIGGVIICRGRRVNVLLASPGCAPHCTRRPASGFCLYDFAPGELISEYDGDIELGAN